MRSAATLVARRPRLVALALVSLVCVLASLWRLSCITLGPDPDTDAYGHYVIARQLLETPGNLRIHWVWLPLHHALIAIGVALGVSLDGVRSANAVLAALPPLMIVAWLDRGESGAPERTGVALTAALAAAAAPLALQLGTTGQMEVMFSCLLTGVAFALQRERHALAAVLMSLAVLTRYESWPLVALIGLVWTLRRARGERPPWALFGCALAPALVISTWAALRAHQGEAWFGFIRDNQAFAENALSHTGSGSGSRLAALGRYMVVLPALQFGVVAPFALLGLRRTLRSQGIWFVLLPLAVLCFLTTSNLTRSQLGLERHFLPLVPFLAIWIAHGLHAIRERLARSTAGVPTGVHAALHTGLPGLALLLLAARLPAALDGWESLTRSALPAERAAAQFLARTPRDAPIVCDEASPEVLSGLAAQRFVRARVGPDVAGTVLALAREHDVFVLTRAERIGAVSSLGELVYGGPSLPFAAVRIRRAPPEMAAAPRDDGRRGMTAAAAGPVSARSKLRRQLP